MFLCEVLTKQMQSFLKAKLFWESQAASQNQPPQQRQQRHPNSQTPHDEQSPLPDHIPQTQPNPKQQLDNSPEEKQRNPQATASAATPQVQEQQNELSDPASERKGHIFETIFEEKHEKEESDVAQPKTGSSLPSTLLTRNYCSVCTGSFPPTVRHPILRYFVLL